MQGEKAKNWIVRYDGNGYLVPLSAHNISNPLMAITHLAKHETPELMYLEDFIVDINREMFLISITPIKDKVAKRKELQQKVADIDEKYKKKSGFKDFPGEVFLGGKGMTYACMIALHAEMVLDEAIQVKRIEILRDLIDEALVSGNKDLFMQYSAELKERSEACQIG